MWSFFFAFPKLSPLLWPELPGFPFLLDQSSVAFGRCRIEGETGSLEVRFGEGSSIALLHLFVKTQVGWWIDGASPADDAVTRKVETS